MIVVVEPLAHHVKPIKIDEWWKLWEANLQNALFYPAWSLHALFFSSLTKDTKKQVLSYYTGHLVGDGRGEGEIGWRKVKGYEREWEESERNILMGGLKMSL